MLKRAKYRSKLTSKNQAVKLAEKAVKSHPLYLAILGFWIFYIYFTFTSPSDTTAQKLLNISDLQVNLIRITVGIPYLLIWLSAAFSFVKIKRYAVAIAPSRESKAFNNIATGVLILLGSLILTTIFSMLRNYFIDMPEIRPILTVLTNYAYVIPYLIAFGFIFYGSTKLYKTIEEVKIPTKTILLYAVPFVIFTYVWLESIFTNEFRIIEPASNIGASYYLKDSLLVLTIVIPSLMCWGMGFLAFIKLRIYLLKVKGLIYKRALKSFVYGFAGIIFASIFLQALLSLGPRRLLDLGLSNLLIIIYLFLIIQGIGFFFVAKGAKNLTKIESV